MKYEESARIRARKTVSGAYLLMNNREVVYVGSARDVDFRIRTHQKAGKKQFDEFAVIECSQSDLLEVEAELIFKYDPIYNSTFPTGTRRFCHLRTIAIKAGRPINQVRKTLRMAGVEIRRVGGAEVVRTENY